MITIKNGLIHYFFIYVLCVSIFIACGNSPTQDDSSDNPGKQPSLENMVFIPAGEFLMGSPKGEGAYDEHPQHKVYLDAFYIDKYEVTNAQFKEFVEATGYVTDAERIGQGEVWNPKAASSYLMRANFSGVTWYRPNAWHRNYPSHPDAWKYYLLYHPVVQVSWNDVQAYAKWKGKRLPTEAEWEKAARGTDGRRWPWGNVFDLNIEGTTIHANIGSEEGLTLVGSFPTGVSPYGLYDMGGNVQEWVADYYAADYYSYSPQNNPRGPDKGQFRVLKGGSWRNQKSYQVHTASREYKLPNYSSNFVGFRCAWDESMLK